MASLMICYDLNKQGQNYAGLIDKIKLLGLWWHCLDSTWIVKSNLTPTQVRDQLMPLIDSNDELLVIDVTGRAAAWAGFNDECSGWLKSNL